VSGNVGIGTSSPDRPLKIGGASASFGIDAGSGELAFDPVSGGFAQIGVSGANALRFNTNNAERIRITSDGKVGIGTNSPSYQVTVGGYGQDTAALTDAGNTGGSIYLRSDAVGVGSGGAVLFGTTFGNGTPFAAIKALIADGGTNTRGDLAFSTRNATTDTALTERMRIDSSGRVTMPYQPYAQGSSSNGYTLASAGFVNGFVIIYNNVDYNVGSHYNNTNGRFTAPVAGVYLVCYTALISTASSSSVDYRLSISINGNQSQTFSSTKSTGWPTVGGSQMVYLNAGDYVAAKFWNDSGSGTMHGDANYNRFSIALIS
jgi:hypothetical protein